MLMRRLFGSLAGNLQWPVLIILSGLFALVLAAMRLPAALLLGPMLAAILVAVFGTGVRVSHRLFLIAQAASKRFSLTSIRRLSQRTSPHAAA
jgi:uncharacterized protein